MYVCMYVCGGQAFMNVPSRAFIKHAIFSTLAANNMLDGVHIRLTLTRGPKLTSSMNPAFNAFGCNRGRE